MCVGVYLHHALSFQGSLLIAELQDRVLHWSSTPEEHVDEMQECLRHGGLVLYAPGDPY